MPTTLPQKIEWFTDLEQGEVLQPITTQSGRVWALGSFWAAELAYETCRSLAVGESVTVLGRTGLTLLVVPSEYRVPTGSHTAAQGEMPLTGWLKKLAMFLL